MQAQAAATAWPECGGSVSYIYTYTLCTHKYDSGLGKNVIAVTIPIAATIFLADMISRARQDTAQEKDNIPMPLTAASSTSASSGKGSGRVSPL